MDNSTESALICANRFCRIKRACNVSFTGVLYDDYKTEVMNNQALTRRKMVKNSQDKIKYLQDTHLNPGSVFYEIKIQGQLDPQRSKWFEGMALSVLENDENGLPCTLISGPVIDQPALHGLLTKIRDLNLTLISVRRFVPRTSADEEVPIRPDPSG